MAHNDHVPLVFKFGEVDSEPEEIENKEELGLMDMVQKELAVAVATPAPVPAPIPGLVAEHYHKAGSRSR